MPGEKYQFLHARRPPYLALPGFDKCLVADRADVARRQFNGVHPQVIAADLQGRIAHPRVTGGHRPHRKGDQFTRLIPQVALRGPRRPPQLLHHLFRLAPGRAWRQGKIGEHQVGFRGWEEIESHPAGEKDGDRQQEQAYRGGNACVALPDSRLHEAGESALAEARETGLETPAPARRLALLAQGLAQMHGQDQEALHQAGANHQPQSDGQLPYHAPDLFFDHHYREERRQRGQRGRQDRRKHDSRSPFGRLTARHARGVQRAGMFRHHDGVVHDNADAHDQREHADHVESQAQRGHSRHCREEGNGNAHRDPESRPPAQEQVQNRQDQQQAAEAVGEQHVHPLANLVGENVEQLHPEAGRRAGAELFEVGLDRLLGQHRVQSPAAPDVDVDRRVLIDQPRHLSFGRSLVNTGDVFQLQALPRFAGQDFQLTQLGRRAGPPLTANLPGDALRFQRPARQVQAGTGDALGHVIQSEIQAPQGLRRHFHPQLALAQAAHADQADAPLQQCGADFPGVRLQRALAERPGDLDVADHFGGLQQPHQGALNLLRKSRYPRHRRLRVGQRLGHVAAEVEVRHQDGASFKSRGVHPVHVVKQQELPFQRLDYVGFQVLGTGARPGDVNLNLLQREVGHELAVELAQTHQPEQDHQHHQQIAGHLVAGEESQEGVGGHAPATPRSAPGRSRRPRAVG